MGIFDRMGRVISSNLNALLDRAEDPKKSIDLTIQEMGDSLRLAKKEIVDALAQQKVIAKKVEELDAETAKWEKRAELALQSNDDALAREAIKQKRRIVAERDRAEALSAEQRGVVLTMKREMERMEAKIEELRARKGTIAGEIQRARQGGGVESLGATGGTGGRAFDDFRRMEAKIDEQRAQAESMGEVDAALHDGLSEAELEAKFAALEGRGGAGAGGKAGDPAIDDEIARLKKKLRIGE
jgi:phage shock protein A